MDVFRMADIFKGEKCIGGKASGSFARNELEIKLAKSPVVVDFESVEMITQSFCDEFLGPILQHEGQDILKSLKFKNCSEDVQAIILSTAGRFLSQNKAVS